MFDKKKHGENIKNRVEMPFDIDPLLTWKWAAWTVI